MVVDLIEYFVIFCIIVGMLMFFLLGFLFVMVALVVGVYIGCGVMGFLYLIYWE